MAEARELRTQQDVEERARSHAKAREAGGTGTSEAEGRKAKAQAVRSILGDLDCDARTPEEAINAVKGHAQEKARIAAAREKDQGLER